MTGIFSSINAPFSKSRITALILLSLGITEAQAQSRYQLEEIVVTSRKIEEGLQNAPLSVTAISGLELENRGALDITDFANIAPNVALKESGTVSGFSAAPRTSIRGIGQGDFVINTDPAVGLYSDGVYLGRSLGSILDLVDVERVEALRGPQGTLFGRNSTGGAINVIAIKPDAEADLNGYVTAAVGEEGYFLLRGSANIPITDTLAARATVLRKERDGFVKSLIYDGLEFGDTETNAGRVALRWTPNDRFTADLDVDLSERTDTAAPTFAVRVGDLSVGETGLSPNAQPTGITSFVGGRVFNGEGFSPPPPPNIQAFQTDDPLCATSQAYRDSVPTCFGNFYAGSLDGGSFAAFFDREGNLERPDDQNIETYGYSVRLNYDFENISISSISSWRGFDSEFINGNATPILISGNRNEVFDQDQFSQEIQVSGSAFGDRLDWLVGGYYFEEDGLERVVVVSPFLPPSFNNESDFLPVGNIQNRFIDNTSKAIFGQGIVRLTDTVDLTIGLRTTEDKKFAQYIVLNDSFDPNDDGVVNLIGRQEATETNTLINLSWQATDNTLIYGQFADGFRSGGFPSRLGGGQTEILEYDPEFVDSYEIGLKTTLFDNRIRLNAAVFDVSYDDIQISAAQENPQTGVAAPLTDNLGDASLTGFEIEASFVATDNLRFDASIGYIDNDIDELVSGGLIINGASNLQKTVTTDNELALVPEWQVNVGANYSAFLASGAEIRTRIDYFYESDQFSDIGNYDQGLIPSNDKVNLNITYLPEDAPWQVTLGARNLTDEENLSGIDINNAINAALYHVPERGREAYLEVKYNFGQ